MPDPAPPNPAKNNWASGGRGDFTTPKVVDALVCRCGKRLGSLAQDGRWVVLVSWTAAGQALVRDAKIVCRRCGHPTWFQARKAKAVVRTPEKV